jgi:hypothetical protein
MTEDEIPNDTPPLKCWIKKSISTSKKVSNFFLKLLLIPDVAIAAIQAVVIVIGCMLGFSWIVGHSIDAAIYHNKRIAAGESHKSPRKPGNASQYNVWDAAALGIVEDKDDE